MKVEEQLDRLINEYNYLTEFDLDEKRRRRLRKIFKEFKDCEIG